MYTARAPVKKPWDPGAARSGSSRIVLQKSAARACYAIIEIQEACRLNQSCATLLSP
jgi:hypothetical protein